MVLRRARIKLAPKLNYARGFPLFLLSFFLSTILLLNWLLAKTCLGHGNSINSGISVK